MYQHYSISAELARQHHNDLISQADVARQCRTTRGQAKRGRLRCLVGLHAWQTHVNRDLGGTEAVYDLCRRCATEKQDYGRPTQGQTIGVAAG